MFKKQLKGITMKRGYIDCYIIITIFLFLFSFSTSLIKIALSITSIMSVVGILILIKYSKKNFIVEVYNKIGNLFKFSYWIFFILIIIASFLINDLESIKKAFKFLYYSLPYWFMLFLSCKDFPKKETAIQNALILSMFCVGCCSVYFYFGLDDGKRLSLFNYGPNALGAILAINLPFLIIFTIDKIEKTKTVFYQFISILTSLLSLMALAATASRGAIIGFVIGFIFLIIVAAKNMIKNKLQLLLSFIILFACVSIVSIMFLHNDYNILRSYDMERVRLVESSYNMWQDNKLVGVGLNNWQENYIQKYILPDAKEKMLEFPHNTIAYFFSTSGIIGGSGFLIFSFGILAYLINCLRHDPNNLYIRAMLWSFVAFSVHGLVDAGFLMKQGERLIFALLGITSASIVFKNNK